MGPFGLPGPPGPMGKRVSINPFLLLLLHICISCVCVCVCVCVLPVQLSDQCWFVTVVCACMVSEKENCTELVEMLMNSWCHKYK